MSKNKLLITGIAIFLLLGTISLAMGATSDPTKDQNKNMAKPPTTSDLLHLKK